jgi:hypothetical protein
MKKIILSILMLAMHIFCFAQDSVAFKGYIHNEEYKVYIKMNFYDKNVIVPGQEIFGELPGYFGSKNDSRKWLFTDAVIKNRTTAEISITNDYGSEDLTATLKLLPDGSYELIQNEGSTLKIVEKRKWVKIPKKIILTR